jgi:hypothetical protein
MGGKPYKDWEEVKKDIAKWRNINIICLVIVVLFLITGVTAETIGKPFGISFSIESTSYLIIAILFVVVSIAPHIQVVALKSWYGVESERKNR